MYIILDYIKNIEISSNLINILIYSAIALITLLGIIKCIFPIWIRAKLLKRATKKIIKSQPNQRPYWKEIRFLGKVLQNDWHRFLLNAEQLELRGLNCNVEDYINDESIVHGPGNAQLADLIPTLLTSLGILGTFIGLMRGLSSLDMTNAGRIMEGIPNLIDGMKFAFATSIAGISCSLIFNMIYRMMVGSAYRNIDNFNDTFSRSIMQKPVETDVQIVLQNQDRGIMLRQATDDISNRITESIEKSVFNIMQPIAISMDNFIAGVTYEQTESIARIVDSFITKMDYTLDGQFLKLGQTIAQINKTNEISNEHIQKSLEVANNIIYEIEELQYASKSIFQHFENVLIKIQNTNDQNLKLDSQTQLLIENIHQTSYEQNVQIKKIQKFQLELEKSMKKFNQWAENHIKNMDIYSKKTQEELYKMNNIVTENSQDISKEYSNFINSTHKGMKKSIETFDKSLKSINEELSKTTKSLSDTINIIPEKIEKNQSEINELILAITSMEKSLTSLNQNFSNINMKND